MDTYNWNQPQGYDADGYPTVGPAQPYVPEAYVPPNYDAPLSQIPYQSDVSPKSKVAAGFLSLFFGCFGIGRFYLGYARLGMIQLSITVVGLFVIGLIKSSEVSSAAAICVVAVYVWSIIDAVLIFAGAIKKDGQGLRIY